MPPPTVAPCPACCCAAGWHRHTVRPSRQPLRENPATVAQPARLVRGGADVDSIAGSFRFVSTGARCGLWKPRIVSSDVRVGGQPQFDRRGSTQPRPARSTPESWKDRVGLGPVNRGQPGHAAPSTSWESSLPSRTNTVGESVANSAACRAWPDAGRTTRTGVHISGISNVALTH